MSKGSWGKSGTASGKFFFWFFSRFVRIFVWEKIPRCFWVFSIKFFFCIIFGKVSAFNLFSPACWFTWFIFRKNSAWAVEINLNPKLVQLAGNQLAACFPFLTWLACTP